MTNVSLRDRRHQQAQKDLGRLERQRDDTLDRLARIAAKLKATRRSIERYQRTPTLPAARPAAPAAVEPPAPSTVPPTAAPATAPASPGDDHPIPAVFRRNAKDDEQRAIEREADLRWRNWTPGKNAKGETKLSRPRLASFIKEVRDERLRWKQRAMPLTGKAALAAIKG